MKYIDRKTIVSAVAILFATACGVLTMSWTAAPKTSVLESIPVPAPRSQTAPVASGASASWVEALNTPAPSIGNTGVALNSAPTALVGFLEMHFDISAKYRDGGDGTFCTEKTPCVDRTPPEVREAILKIYDGVLARLGDKYDSETFWRVFFIAESWNYDPSTNSWVRIDNIDGSVNFIVEKYLVRMNSTSQ